MAGFAPVGRDFCEPDGSFHRLHLTKERAYAAKAVVPPVLQQPRGFGGDAPVAWVGQTAPNVYLGAHAVDDGGVVALFCVRNFMRQIKMSLTLSAAVLFGPGDGRDEFGSATRRGDVVGGLAGFIQHPVRCGVGIG